MCIAGSAVPMTKSQEISGVFPQMGTGARELTDPITKEVLRKALAAADAGLSKCCLLCGLFVLRLLMLAQWAGGRW